MYLDISFKDKTYIIKELFYCKKESLFGEILLVGTLERLVAIGFANEDYTFFLKAMAQKWNTETIKENPNAFPMNTNSILHREGSYRLLLKATDFERKVWTALAKVQSPVSYGELARLSDCPTAVRAASTAVGHNPVSLLLPCHRIIRRSGAIGNYLWGTKLKSALLDWENTHSIWQIPTTISVE